MNLLLIAVGGAAGALARYGLSGWIQGRTGFFPWGTLAVNVLGSLVLGFTVRFLAATTLSADCTWRAASFSASSPSWPASG